MKVQILNNETKVLVRRDDALKLKIAQLNKIKVASVDRWLREDDVMLTTVSNMQLIKEHLGIAEEVIITEPKQLEVA